MIESFIFYRSFHEATKDLPKERYGALVYAINEYALNGEETELPEYERRLFMLIKPQIDANAARRINGRFGGRPKKEDGTEEKKTEAAQNAPAEEQKKEPTEKKAEPARFVKPTVEEIADYCRERKNGLDAQAFFDFYESKGWKVGAAKMRDWKASVRTWEQRRKTEASGGRTRAGAMWGRENEIPDEISDLF